MTSLASAIHESQYCPSQHRGVQVKNLVWKLFLKLWARAYVIHNPHVPRSPKYLKIPRIQTFSCFTGYLKGLAIAREVTWVRADPVRSYFAGYLVSIGSMSFKLPDLPYDYSALEPSVDATTMQVDCLLHFVAVKNAHRAHLVHEHALPYPRRWHDDHPNAKPTQACAARLQSELKPGVWSVHYTIDMNLFWNSSQTCLWWHWRLQCTNWALLIWISILFVADPPQQAPQHMWVLSSEPFHLNNGTISFCDTQTLQNLESFHPKELSVVLAD